MTVSVLQSLMAIGSLQQMGCHGNQACGQFLEGFNNFITRPRRLLYVCHVYSQDWDLNSFENDTIKIIR